MAYDYDDAGSNAQPEVKAAMDRFRRLPEDIRAKKPLWSWLLGEGTPRFKVSAEDSEYVDKSPDDHHVCANCEFFYLHIPTHDGICSEIEPRVKAAGWCNRWLPIAEEGTRERDLQDRESKRVSRISERLVSE